MSDNVLERIVDLMFQGYDVRFMPVFKDACFDIRIRKDNYTVAHTITKEMLDKTRFDVVLYTIDRIVDELEAISR